MFVSLADVRIRWQSLIESEPCVCIVKRPAVTTEPLISRYADEKKAMRGNVVPYYLDARLLQRRSGTLLLR